MGIVGQAVWSKYKFVSIMIKRFVTPYKARQVAGFDPFFCQVLLMHVFLPETRSSIVKNNIL